MFETLFYHIQEKVEFTAEELVQLESYFIPKKLKKHQYLLQEGEVCKYMAFVTK